MQTRRESTPDKSTVRPGRLQNFGNVTRRGPMAVVGDRFGRLGRFELLELVGEGGGGLVYRAMDKQLEREVAVKTLHAPAADAFAGEQLLLEARVLARLDHENIVRLYDAGTWKRTPYFVMEYVAGRSLADLVSQLDQAEGMRVVADVARAVAYAHERGALHLDIKPSNVLVSDGGRVKLIDFGGAACFESIRVHGESERNSLLGTPAYMSPEQWSMQTIDERADVWAMGILLCEVLTGRLPFATAKPRSANFADLVASREIVLEPLARVNARAADVAARALARDPSARTSNGQQFLEELCELQRRP